MSVYNSETCWKIFANPNIDPRINVYNRTFWKLKLICFNLSNSKYIKKGNSPKKPINNLEAQNVYGPIKSIPVSCATNVVPQRKEQPRAQEIGIKLFLMTFTNLIFSRQQAWKQNLYLNFDRGERKISLPPLHQSFCGHKIEI